MERDYAFVDDLGRVRADDVNTQKFVVARLADDLDEALLLAEYARLGGGGERELRDLHVVTQLLRLRLRQPDRSHFRVAVSTRRHVSKIYRVRLLPRDLLCDEYAFFRGEVRERGVCLARNRDHVADGVDVRFARSAELVHLDVAALDFYLRPLKPQAFRERHAPDGDEKHLRFERDVFALRVLTRRAHARVRSLHLLKFRPRERFDAALAERFFKLLRDLFVFERHQSRQQFNERRLRAEARVDGGELRPDRTRPDDDERLRHFLEFEYVIGVYDALAVGLEAGDGTDDRACCD